MNPRQRKRMSSLVCGRGDVLRCSSQWSRRANWAGGDTGLGDVRRTS
jgi:hypothetical protein